MRETNNEPNKWYRKLEGEGAKEKLRARKNRPEGWGEVLNRIREVIVFYIEVLYIEGASSVSLPGKERSAKALWPAEQRGGTEEEMRADCESLVRTLAFIVTSG